LQRLLTASEGGSSFGTWIRGGSRRVLELARPRRGSTKREKNEQAARSSKKNVHPHRYGSVQRACRELKRSRFRGVCELSP
jgi:hypothetical protein